jgi:hypothetical protein
MLFAMKFAPNAEQFATSTLHLAQLQVALQVCCRAFKYSHELVDACLLVLEASDVRRYPLADMGDAQIDQSVQVGDQILNPKILRHVMARTIVCMRQNLESGLARRRLRSPANENSAGVSSI